MDMFLNYDYFLIFEVSLILLWAGYTALLGFLVHWIKNIFLKIITAIAGSALWLLPLTIYLYDQEGGKLNDVTLSFLTAFLLGLLLVQFLIHIFTDDTVKIDNTDDK
jgi:hypothetical protein